MGSNGKYILMNDIDLSGVEWTAKNLNAGAEFNGNGYAVSNMVTSGTSSYQGGLFGANSGTIKNLKVTDAVISGRRDLGILSATNSGLIENCFVSGSISATQEFVGGMVAFNNGEIKYSDADVVLDGANLLAGLVSQNTGTIEFSTSRGEINATGGVSGGLVAKNQGIIKNSSTIANITIGGGFVGSNSGTIENASASGNVTVNGSGFVGTNSGTIRNATASGNVTGTGTNGGFVGNNGGNALIENCSATGNVTSTGANSGGFAGSNVGTIKNATASGEVRSTSTSPYYANVGGLVGQNASTGKIENTSASGNVTAVGGSSGGLIGQNKGIINNSMASGIIDGTNMGGGLVGTNDTNAEIHNSSAFGKVSITGDYAGGLVGSNNGIIKNSSASGEISGSRQVGGFVGSNATGAEIESSSSSGNVSGSNNAVGGFAGGSYGTIKNSCSSGDVEGTVYLTGGFVGIMSGVIDSSYSLGNVSGTQAQYDVGGFAGCMNNGTIMNSYAKGNVDDVNYAGGGFVGEVKGDNNVVTNSYSIGSVTGNGSGIAGFVGKILNDNSLIIENSYAYGKVNSTNASAGAFVGNEYLSMVNIDNCYANSEQASNIKTEQAGVSAMPASWFEDGNNLTFLGSAYDYYYNPPELWGNGEAHPEEFTQFQVGANSGEKNQLELNLVFKMNMFYGDVSSVDAASATLERVDAFKERLSEHRSMIGAVRNRLDSVLESQSIRLENLNSSHSTIVDTDFAAETAKLTRNQILQQATSSLLSQANFMPNIALQLLQ